MKIFSNTKFKSIPPLQEITLPDLVVLYGVNGAGKTHLLKALSNKDVTKIVDENGSHLDKRKWVLGS